MKYISILLLLAAIQLQGISQTSARLFLQKNIQYNLILTGEPFGTGVGVIHKVALRFLNTQHIESLGGLVFHHHHSFKSKYETNISPLIPTNDLSFYITNDWKYYPFRQKTFFIEIGVFMGYTSIITKGSLAIAKYQIVENFHTIYNYLNYGSTQSIGYALNKKIELSLCSYISLRGLLDKGRTRLAEVDSRFLIGLNLGVKI